MSDPTVGELPPHPLLRCFGGKWGLADWIIGHFPDHRTYVEPFGGGASVLLRKPPSRAEVYNDNDGEVVNLFRVAREHGDALRRAIELTPYSRDELVLSHRETDDSIERARRTLVRCWMGYGDANACTASGFLRDSKRNGAVTWDAFADSIGVTIRRLRRVIIEHRNALDLILEHDRPDTLFYVDAPYLKSAGRDIAVNPWTEMSIGEHERLADILRGVQGAVVLSGYASTHYRQFYPDWICVRQDPRQARVRRRRECLWLSREPNAPMPSRDTCAARRGAQSASMPRLRLLPADAFDDDEVHDGGETPL